MSPPNGMRTRHDDTTPDQLSHHAPQPLVKFTREIPLPWLLGAVAAFIGWAGAMYYEQRGLVSKVSEMAVEMRTLAASASSVKESQTEQRFEINMVKNDISDIKRQLATREREINAVGRK